MSLSATLLSALPAAVNREIDTVALDELLDRALAEARAAWPGVSLPDDIAVRYFADRVPHDRPVLDALAWMRTSELYLACACTLGDPTAVLAIDRLLNEIAPAVAAVDREDARDVIQALRERLLVGTPAQIADYSGAGELQGWLRVVAVRSALSIRRKRNREVALDEAVAPRDGALDPTSDPHLAHLKRIYHAEFKDAFRESLAQLDDRDRSLLRHRYVYGANVDEIAQIYAVHRATAARWTAHAEQRLYAATRAALMSKLKIDRSELDSVMRLLHSQLDASLHGLLSRG